MVDGCSITARLGTRKWGPRFQLAFSVDDQPDDERTAEDFEDFLRNPLHGDIEKCFALRPTTKLVLN